MKGSRVCKICGKEYPYCKTENPNNVFRYQDVACCPEHGAQYLREVLIARGELVEDEPKKASPKKGKKADPEPEPKVVESLEEEGEEDKEGE
jgi:hypothetical protein